MKFILCIALSIWISPTLASFKAPQRTLEPKEFKDSAEPALFKQDRNIAAEYIVFPEFLQNVQGMERRKGDSTLVDFDDIELAVPFASITKYSNLTLGGFSLMNVPLAYKNGSLAPEDIDCATSAPYALIGSRSKRSVWPRISLSGGFPGATSLSEAKSFMLLNLSVKSLGAIPSYLTVFVRGWLIEDGRAVDNAYLSRTYLQDGHQSVLPLNLTHFTAWRKNFTVIEMWAESIEGKD